jgi:hypothetical protein
MSEQPPARVEDVGPPLAGRATAKCAICEEGIYQCGHRQDADGEYRPYWLHVDGPAPGVRGCERFPGAVASPF